MSKIITQCPSCESNQVKVVKIECGNCDTKFEGSFDLSPLLRLPEENLEFIIQFIKCSGSLKEMAIMQKVSYPTLRNRLNTLIDLLKTIEDKTDVSTKEEILQMLEEGKISAREAASMLTRL